MYTLQAYSLTCLKLWILKTCSVDGEYSCSFLCRSFVAQHVSVINGNLCYLSDEILGSYIFPGPELEPDSSAESVAL